MSAVIEARFFGDDPLVLRELAEQAREIMEQDPAHNCVRLDWHERVTVFRPQIRKDVMQSLGLTRPLINNAVLEGTSGLTIGAFRDKNKSLPILFGLVPEERNKIENLYALPIWSPAANKAVTLGSVISGIEVSYEDEIIMRRNRRRVLTAASDVVQRCRKGYAVKLKLYRFRLDIDLNGAVRKKAKATLWAECQNYSCRAYCSCLL